MAHSWSGFWGSTIALKGDIEQPGWRLRTSGGYSQYSYRKWVRGHAGPAHMSFTGSKTFSDVLLGYHSQFGRITLKSFAGLSSLRHVTDPRDSQNASADFSYGGKIALEAWISLSNRHWVATNLSWASTFNTAKLELRTGYSVLDDVDLGLEARIEGTDRFDTGRAGAFATLRLGDAGITASAGLGLDPDMRSSAFASVNLFYRY